jgi:hypothetical protein
MKKNILSSHLLFLVVSLLCTGCINLKHINDFSSESLKGLQGFEALPITYQGICTDDCKEKDIESGKLNASKCDCKDARLADSVDYLFYKTVAAYLDGLERLSANETTSYNFDSLGTQLSGLGVSAADAGAYAKLGSILTKAVTDGYRSKKIKEYIKDANDPLQIIIRHLKSNIGGSLTVDLGASRSKLESDYFKMLRNSSGNAFEKRKIIDEFYGLRTGIDSELSTLREYSSLLQCIADGHQQLANNLDKIDEAGLKAMITQYASNIKDIHTQIQILNKK